MQCETCAIGKDNEICIDCCVTMGSHWQPICDNKTCWRYEETNNTHCILRDDLSKACIDNRYRDKVDREQFERLKKL